MEFNQAHRKGVLENQRNEENRKYNFRDFIMKENITEKFEKEQEILCIFQQRSNYFLLKNIRETFV